MERLDRLNANREYVYRVESAVVFGSMLSDAERLGDGDIAVELQPVVTQEVEFRSRCEARRLLASRRGTHFSSTVDWVLWPKTEIFRALRARAFSLHEWDQLVRIPEVRYRVLLGDRERIAGMISNGEPIEV
jgi:hypothetical protein